MQESTQKDTKWTKIGAASILARLEQKNRPVIFNFLMDLVHGEFNFQCTTRPIEIFQFLNFHYDQRVPRLNSSIFKFQSCISKIHTLRMKLTINAED